MARNVFLSAFILILSLSGCERLGSVNISIEGGNMPAFNLSGTGNLVGVYVYGPRPGDLIAVPEGVPVWAIHIKPGGPTA